MRARTLAAVAGTLMGLVRPSAPEAAAQEPSVQRPSSQKATVARYWYRGAGLAAFREGYRAWELGEWKTTKSKMEQALKADPKDQPEAQVRTGAGWITPYIPSYYLALARCKLDKCSENPDLVLKLIKDADSRLLKRHQSDCMRQNRCPPSRTPVTVGRSPSG